MAKKVIVGQPEKPNASTVAARDPAVELPDAHIQRVADISLMTSAEVTALLSPTLANHETRLGTVEQVAGHTLIESPSENVVPVGALGSSQLLSVVAGVLKGQVVSDFAVKASPTAADLLLVSDAAASNVLRQITLQALMTLVAQTSLLNPYLAKPASPNAFDDEFDAGSPDLGVRGYTVVNASTGTVQTRPAGNAGNIAPWDATGPAAGTYWSQIIGSTLYFQGTPGVQYDIYKTISLAAGDTYFARVSGSFNMATNSNGRFNEVGFYGASGAMLDGNNRVYTTIRDDTTTSYLISDMARTTAGSNGSGAAGRLALGSHDIRGVRFDSGTTHYALMVGGPDNEVKTAACTGAPAAGTLTRFAIRNLFSTAGSIVPQLWAIDFIRKKTGNAWLIP